MERNVMLFHGTDICIIKVIFLWKQVISEYLIKNPFLYSSTIHWTYPLRVSVC